MLMKYLWSNSCLLAESVEELPKVWVPCQHEPCQSQEETLNEQRKKKHDTQQGGNNRHDPADGHLTSDLPVRTKQTDSEDCTWWNIPVLTSLSASPVSWCDSIILSATPTVLFSLVYLHPCRSVFISLLLKTRSCFSSNASWIPLQLVAY